MALFGKNRRQPEPEPVIDLRDPEPAPPTIVFGMPAPCPDCGHAGYLDSINTFDRAMYQHCTACGAKWVIFERDIVSASS